MHVLKEKYASYRVKPDRSAQKPQGGYAEDDHTKYANSVDHFVNFLFTQRSGLQHPKTSGKLSLAKIRPGSRWKTPTRFSLRSTALKWTKRGPPLQSMLSQRIKRQLPRNKKSLSSRRNRNNKHKAAEF
jgi:hypothetical protein